MWPDTHGMWSLRLLVLAQDMHNEIQDVLGQSFGVPEDLDEDELMGELDALEDEMASELESGGRAGVPSYLQVRSWALSSACAGLAARSLAAGSLAAWVQTGS